MKNIIALDIGTRKITGLYFRKAGEKIIVYDKVRKEHPRRPIKAGQVHNIKEVSALCGEITGELEKRNKIKADECIIAVAGKYLVSRKLKVSVENDAVSGITEDTVDALRIRAVREAQAQLEKDRSESFFCVGHIVTAYLIDGLSFELPYEHRGRRLEIEAIVYFLPLAFVEGKLASVTSAGIPVYGITLEPVAASNILFKDIDSQMNIILIDIGAGTTDIAFMDNKLFYSFSSIPSGGDNITDFLCGRYFVSFTEGERIKKALTAGEEHISFRDIAGRPEMKTKSEILRDLLPLVDGFVKSVCDEIRLKKKGEITGVFCVGGGSRTINLRELLSAELNVPPDRVIVGDIGNITSVSDTHKKLESPEDITCLGIASMYDEKEIMLPISFSVNGKNLSLLLPPFGGLSLAGLIERKIADFPLYELPGRSLSFSVNGTVRESAGGAPLPVLFTVNGSERHSDYRIMENDAITVRPPAKGADACLKISRLIETADILHISFNGESKTVYPGITVNGLPAMPETQVNDFDEIEIIREFRLGQVLQKLGFRKDALDLPFIFSINGETHSSGCPPYVFFINGKKTSTDMAVSSGDEIRAEVNPDAALEYEKALAAALDAKREQITVVANQTVLKREKYGFEIRRQGIPVSAGSGHCADLPFSDTEVLKIENEYPVCGFIVKEHLKELSGRNEGGPGYLSVKIDGRTGALNDKIKNNCSISLSLEK